MKKQLFLLLFTALIGLQATFGQTVVQSGTFKLNGVTVSGKAERNLSVYPKTTQGNAAFKALAESTSRPFAITVTSGARSGEVLAALYTQPSGSVAPPNATNVAQWFPIEFTYNGSPNRINRMQGKPHGYADGWKFKQSEVVIGGNGGITESPRALYDRGHNWLNARMFFFTSDQLPYGPPLSTDNLFLEIGGGEFQPYHRNPVLLLSQSMQDIANTLSGQLPIVNNTPERGLVNGVATIKSIHYNIEYYWFTDDNWNAMSSGERNSTFFNYATNQTETFQAAYNRGGAMEITYAVFAKWRNIIYFSTQWLKRVNPGINAFYGDYWGIAPFTGIRYWSKPYSIESLFSADVNDPGKFSEANEYANAGNISVGGFTYNVSGNLRELFQESHVYNYEADVQMSVEDFNAFNAAPESQRNINLWYDKIRPDLSRPYDWMLNAALSEYVKAQKGWPNYKLIPQHESIYEFNITNKANGQFLNGAFVGWTLGDNNVPKIPLHPEVKKTLLFMDRMFYQGSFSWGSTARINPDQRQGENLHPAVHQVGREAEQDALDQLAPYESVVFQPGKRTHIRDIPVLNPATGQYVTGGPHILLMANGNADTPVPLVVGVDNPANGWELYMVYYPNATRTGTTNVTWKSPIDGAVLTGTAVGWGGRLYARKRP